MKAYVYLLLALCVCSILAQTINPVLDNRVIGKRATILEMGEAKLNDGSAKITLKTPTDGYIVVLTPLGQCGQLYISKKNEKGFTVNETAVGEFGKSNVAFEFIVLLAPREPQQEPKKNEESEKNRLSPEKSDRDRDSQSNRKK